MFKLSGRFLLQYNNCMFKTRERLLFSLLISIILLKYFYYEFYKNFRDRYFLIGFLIFVYLVNYIKLLQTAAFEFINYQLLITFLGDKNSNSLKLSNSLLSWVLFFYFFFFCLKSWGSSWGNSYIHLVIII